MKNPLKFITLGSFSAVFILIAVLIFFPEKFQKKEKNEFRQTKIITSNPLNDSDADVIKNPDGTNYNESAAPRIALNEGEIIVSTRTEDFDGDISEEQIIIYRNLLEENNPIYITYIDYDEETKTYRRIWSLPTAITRPATVSLYTQDLLGDRSNCIIVSGLNSSGKRVMTIFSNKQNDKKTENNIFREIADIAIDGTISIVEVERSQAYYLGITPGTSFNIAARGSDSSSSNAFDQIEITYSYNSSRGAFEQSRVIRIPGSQVEAARLSELLNAGAPEFEQYIEGLWYHVNGDGSINNNRYVYFDTQDRELIFYDENTQQVYNWLASSPTRYGLYISSQNISVATLRRVMDIELESLDGIRMKVFEDVRMKIGINAPWDGSYRKASSIQKKQENQVNTIQPYIDDAYNSSIGIVRFSLDGNYTVELNGNFAGGKYVFFMLEGQELLELLPDQKTSGRETYRVIRNKEVKDISLIRIRLTTKGAQEFHESEILLTKVSLQ